MEILTHLAIAHPTLAFRLTEGAGTTSRFRRRGSPGTSGPDPGRGQGAGAAQGRVRVGAFRRHGYAALPSLTEGSRAHQTISVNGRFVRAESLNRGLDDAYRATVPSGRYPPVAVEITADPRRVDVNVHPTKQVVRFSEERAAREAVAAAIRTPSSGAPQPHLYPTSPGENVHPGALLRVLTSTNGLPSYAAEDPSPTTRRRRGSAGARTPLGGIQATRRTARGGTRTIRGAAGKGWLPQAAPEDLRVIGQLATGYILVEEPGALWVVDQHVAHERAILDRLNDSDSPATVQSLLVPEVVDLSPAEAELAAASLEELSVYGFEAEPFGPRSVRVTAVISTLADRDIAGASKGRPLGHLRHRAGPPPRGPHPRHHSLPLGRKDGRQALARGDGGPHQEAG